MPRFRWRCWCCFRIIDSSSGCVSAISGERVAGRAVRLRRRRRVADGSARWTPTPFDQALLLTGACSAVNRLCAPARARAAAADATGVPPSGPRGAVANLNRWSAKSNYIESAAAGGWANSWARKPASRHGRPAWTRWSCAGPCWSLSSPVFAPSSRRKGVEVVVPFACPRAAPAMFCWAAGPVDADT